MEKVVDSQADFEDRYTVAMYFFDVVCAPIPIAMEAELAAMTVEHTVFPVVASGSHDTPGHLQEVVLLTYDAAFIATSELKYSVASGSLPLAGMQVYSVNELYRTVNGFVGEVAPL
jgi:hypothetical protein